MIPVNRPHLTGDELRCMEAVERACHRVFA
jgi:hypothetical protein